jgi:hypothetical protein
LQGFSVENKPAQFGADVSYSNGLLKPLKSDGLRLHPLVRGRTNDPPLGQAAQAL